MALDHIEAELVGGVPHQTCAVCHYMSERGDEWASQLRRLLANRGIQFRKLADRLKADADEPTIPWEALSRHARGLCSAGEVLR